MCDVLLYGAGREDVAYFTQLPTENRHILVPHSVLFINFGGSVETTKREKL
jgi:hypothetical protein